MPADDLSDLSSRHTLFGHAVIGRPAGTFLKRESVEMRNIEAMHRGPAVEPVADICGNALFSCDPDQVWHKAVLTVAVDRWRKPHDRCPDSACCQRKSRLLRLAGRIKIGRILFCRRQALALKDDPTDEQRTIRARERAAECLDGTPIRLGNTPIVCEINDNSGVDHAVGSSCSAAKAIEIFERAAMYGGSRRKKGFGARI